MKKITLLAFMIGLSVTDVSAQAPATAAPTPTVASSNVISMFSNAYTNVPVNTWHTDWSAATLTEVQIAGNDTKQYTDLNFVGVETVGPNMIDATAMQTLHIDIWTPNMTSFRIKLVDFGANGEFAGGDDTEHEITFIPVQNNWNSYDIPLSNFLGLTSRAHLAQMIFSGDPAGSGTLYVDNVYFSNVAVTEPAPTAAAPTPTRDPSTVISMFSNAYTNVPVNTWKTDWSVATYTEVQVAGNDTKKYSALNFVGIETVGPNMIDATTMQYFHVDAWTPNMTTFRIKLVDFGADGAFAGGDDVEHELTFTPTQNAWNSYDIPLANFTGLTTREHIAQLIFSGNPAGSGTVYIDNVYFSSVPLSTAKFTAHSLKIYPNPVSDLVTIEAASALQKVTVYNILGQQVLSIMPQAATATLDVSALQAGVYVLQAESDGNTISQRIIKI
jgi:hypothetical protein